MGVYDHIHTLPVLFHVKRAIGESLPDNGALVVARLAIDDVLSDPENPLADFGEEVGLRYVRVWWCAWSITVNLGTVFTGDNPSNLIVEVSERAAGNLPIQSAQLRLGLPYAARQYPQSRVHFKGRFIIDSQEAFFTLRNTTGMALTIDWDVFAKAYA